MAKILDKTVIGMNAPKQTNVTWIDTSDGTPVQRNNINGKWKPVGGGAGSSRGGSSNPTESDVNKVWQVTPVHKGTNTKETVIVPEQTCNMESDKGGTTYILQNVDESFGPGFSGIVILDGNEYSVEWLEGNLYFEVANGINIKDIGSDNFQLTDANYGSTHTIKVITIETEPIYDYNWVPGVKIPVPTAEDEGKILVVTKTEDNASIIVPEQSVPVDNETPLTDVDLTKFVAGNTVKVTVSANSETITETGVIEEKEIGISVVFEINGTQMGFVQIANSLYTDIGINVDPNSTIKLEYIELNYEYQLQENSGGSSESSNILYCEGSKDSGIVTAYIDLSELDNPQITTIVVDTGDIGEGTSCFYRMNGKNWLVSGFTTFADSSDYVKQWDTSGQYPTIVNELKPNQDLTDEEGDKQ